MIKSLALIICLLVAGSAFAQGADTFRLHVMGEISSVLPAEQKNSLSAYLTQQLFGTLMKYQDKELKPDLAEKCSFKKSTLVECVLRKDLKWSDGTALTGEDFVRAFRMLVNPESRPFHPEILFPVKNAREIYAGKKKPEELGVKIQGRSLLFELEKPFNEFLYVLINPLLIPLPKSAAPKLPGEALKILSSGPYRVREWISQKKVTLENNPYYWNKNPQRPLVEFVYITEDSVALNLYEKNELAFLRRLPTLFIPKYRGRPDYFEVNMLRFDYWGFGPRLKENFEARKALAHSLDFEEMRELYQSPGKPGCPGVSLDLVEKEECYDFNKELANKNWALAQKKPLAAPLNFHFSKQGGDDLRRSGEWMQAQWKKNIEAQIQIAQIENKIYLESLEKNPSDLFRKGVAPERPTCLAALENFSKDHPENYLHIDEPEFEKILATLGAEKAEAKKKSLCSKAIHFLMERYYMIPTGRFFFTILVKPEWKGWKLNQMNHLDLSGLHKSP